MKTAKVFQSGNSQAIRLPKEFRLRCDRVTIRREGRVLIIEPIDDWADRLFDTLESFSEDFMEHGREQPPMQEREALEEAFGD